MKNLAMIGILVALATGILIGIQSTLSSRGGQIIGPFRTGLITNLGGGLFVLVFVALTIPWRTLQWQNLTQPISWVLLASGGLGILIVIGVSFALRYTGVAAGAAGLILGQLLISSLVDALGLNGTTPIPLDLRRIAGLLVMALAVYLLLPRS